MEKPLVSLILIAGVACATPSPNEGPRTLEEETCGRYRALVDGACQDVVVSGIESRELAFERDGYSVLGTLTLPVANGTYRPPVFVLVHGSGPNDRDETSQGNLGVGYGQDILTFRMLAEALSEAGAAVYRYDKRTCFQENSGGRCPVRIADYPGNIDTILVDDFIADFRSAVRAVAALPEVDGSDVTVVGHSQGANFVPLLMADEPGVVAGVQLAGGSLPIDRLIVEQLRDFAAYFEELRASPDQIAELLTEANRFEDALSQIRAGTYGYPSFDSSSVGFWKNWMERTDRLEEEFTRIDNPILLLNGDLDFNVPPKHLERFQGWAVAAGKTNATFGLLNDVTHAFVTVTDGGRRLDPRLSPHALEALISWHRGIALE